MPRARVNGVEIDYEDGGRGPAVLLSHGYSATGRMWAPQRPVLEPSYRLITWDMRGHGQTDSPADPAQYSEALTVEDMRGLLAYLGVERAVIGGLSLGGTMSLAFHRRHPEMVRALVICDSGPGYRNDEARAGWNKRAHERAADLEARGLAALTSSSREMQEAMRHHRSAQGLAHAARGMLAQEGAAIIDSLPTHPGAHAHHPGRPRHPVHRPVRVHGQEDPRRAPRGHQGRRPFLEPRPARGLQPRAARLPRLAVLSGHRAAERTSP